MRSLTARDLWTEFCTKDRAVDPETPFQVWYFGNSREMSIELASLVLTGRKTATASSERMNTLQPENAPQVGVYSVVTDFDGEAQCVIRTTEVRHLPFHEVDAQFAADEGEGDLSLEFWREVHWAYFMREAREFGFDFDEHSIVCCERFELLFPR